MTDLTEQWKKGELPNGWYYVKLIRGEYRIDLYINGKNEWIDCPDNIIDSVVCEVPSYEELQSMNEAVNQAMAANIKLVEKERQLKNIITEMCCQLVDDNDDMSLGLAEYFDQDLLIKIKECLK